MRVPQDTQTPSSPFLSPAWLLSRRKRRRFGGGSKPSRGRHAKPLPILHCPWQSAILPFHLATLVTPDILSSFFFFFFFFCNHRGTWDLLETKRWIEWFQYRNSFLGRILMKVDADEIFENIRNCQRMGKYYRNIIFRGFFSRILFYTRSYVSINLEFITACNVLITRVNLCDIFSFEIIIFGWWTKMWKYKCERDDSPIRRSNDTVESIPKAETRRNAINSTHSRNIPVTRIMIFWLGYQ